MTAIMLPPLAIDTTGTIEPTTVDLAKLTSGEIGGSGVFDTLMSVSALYLDAEFKKNRITGKEYAQAWLGIMAAVMQQSVAFLSISKQVEKLNAEIGLIRQQIVTELVKTDDNILSGLGFNNGVTIEGSTAKEHAILTKTLDKLVAEISLATKQEAKIESEIDLLDQKVVTEVAQVNDTLPPGIGLNTAVMAGVIQKQKELYAAQTAGFARDAEQKVLAEFLRTWAVRRTTDEGTLVPANMNDNSINTVIAKAASGIGIPTLG